MDGSCVIYIDRLLTTEEWKTNLGYSRGVAGGHSAEKFEKTVPSPYMALEISVAIGIVASSL